MSRSTLFAGLAGTLALAAACTDTPSTDATSSALTVHVPGDFNWDNQSDLIFQRRTDMTLKIWTMSGTSPSTTLQPSPVGPVDRNWGLVATPDLSDVGGARFGSPDLLFQNETSGRLVAWFLDEDLIRTWGGFTNPMGPTKPDGSPNPSLSVRGASQINDDDDFDICFYNPNGATRQWLMSGINRISDSLLVPASDHVLLGCADFSGDGRADMVYQDNVTGNVEIWEHDLDDACTGDWCVHPVSTPAGFDQLLGAIGDYNGDGHLDLVFQGRWIPGDDTHPPVTNTAMTIWLMHYYTKIGEAAVPAPGDYWRLVGPK